MKPLSKPFLCVAGILSVIGLSIFGWVELRSNRSCQVEEIVGEPFAKTTQEEDTIINHIGSEEDNQQLENICKAIVKRDATTLSKYVEYPLPQEYPLKDIENKEEFIQAFDRLIPAMASQQIDTARFDDWTRVGWRGIMYQHGEIWLNDDSIIRAIHFGSDKEKVLINRLCREECKILGIDPNKQVSELCYLALDSSLMIHITQDTCVKQIYTCGEGYTIRAYKRGNHLDKPFFCAKGKKEVAGSCGNTDYFAIQDSVLIDVWNCYCEVETNMEHGCSFRPLQAGETLDNIVYELDDDDILMQRAYLRDIAQWW